MEEKAAKKDGRVAAIPDILLLLLSPRLWLPLPVAAGGCAAVVCTPRRAR